MWQLRTYKSQKTKRKNMQRNLLIDSRCEEESVLHVTYARRNEIQQRNLVGSKKIKIKCKKIKERKKACFLANRQGGDHKLRTSWEAHFYAEKKFTKINKSSKKHASTFCANAHNRKKIRKG